MITTASAANVPVAKRSDTFLEYREAVGGATSDWPQSVK